MKPFSSILLLFASFISFGQSNLIGHWPLDSNAFDISGNNYHGIIFGATPDTGHTGMPGTAYRFDGVNDYIVIDEDSAFDFETLDTFEITFWMKPDLNFVAGSANDVITKWKDQTNFNDDYPFCIRILNTGGQNYGKIYAARFSRYCLQSPRTTSDSSLRDSLWHFVQFSRSSDDSLRLYVDGYLQETSWDSTSCSTSTIDSLYFGRRGGNKNHSFYKGLLDDIKIYGGRIYPPGPCSLNMSVSVFTDSLRADINNADHYQWFKCSPNGLIILPSDTFQVISNLSKGSYSVVATKNGCTDTSSCIYYTPLQNNCLVGSWPLNGNANDASGHGFHGTVYGAIPTTGRTGTSNSAYYFDGQNDYIEINHDSMFDFSANDTFAISLWFKLTSANQIPSNGAANTLLSKWQDSSNFNADFPYEIRLFNQLHPKDGQIFGLRYSRQCQQYPRVESESSFHDGKFHHVLFVRMSDDSLRLYIDGKLESTQHDFISCSTNNNLALEFGRRGGAKNPSWFRGVIDDVKIYGTCWSTNPPPPSPTPCGLDTTLTITSNAIVSNENKADHYQWYKCDSGMVKLNGDTNMALYPSANGHYLLVLSGDTCSDSSACMPFTLIGIAENSDKGDLILYPNPAGNHISFNINLQEGSLYRIFNAIGERVDEGTLNKKIIAVDKLPTGFYLVQITRKEGVLRASFFKK